MNKNLFEVGEVVVIQSKINPEYNGEGIVEKVKLDSFLCVDGSRYKGWTYVLEDQPDKSRAYIEPSLRKKHKGCGQDYNEMIKSLNLDIVEVV